MARWKFSTEFKGAAHLEDGPSVSAETFTRIGCNSSVVMPEDRDAVPSLRQPGRVNAQ